MIEFRGQTFGLDEFNLDVRRETLRDAKPLVAESARLIADRMRREVERVGPTPPGTPVGKEDGYLQGAIGSSTAEIHRDTVTAFVGVGAGRDGRAGAAAGRAAGVNVFEYATVHEYGGRFAGRTYPPRSFVRYTVSLMEPHVDALLEAGL